MNPNITAQATRRNTQLSISETGWGMPHKDAIIVGERKRAAPHGSCGAGRVPRGPVARGTECRMAGFHGGASQGGRREASRRQCCCCWHEQEQYLLLFHLPSTPTAPGGSVQASFQLLLPRSRLLWGRTVTQNTSCCAWFGGLQ